MFEDIVASIDGRLSDARGEIQRLERARTVLVQNHEPVKRQRRTNSAKPTVVPAGKLITLLTKEGIGTEALSKQTGGTSSQILTVLKELEANGDVRRTGSRRGTRWFKA